MAQGLYIVQGATFIQPFRWGVEPLIYKPVSAVVGLAPLRLTVPTHGIPDGWRVEAMSFKGLRELNSTGKDKPTDYHYVTVVDTNTVEFNEVNAIDYEAYVSGGILKFYTPKNIEDFDAELTIWDKVNGNVLLTQTSALGDGLVIDTAKFVITSKLEAVETSELTWKRGVFALKMTDTVSGVVTEIAQGPVTVEVE